MNMAAPIIMPDPPQSMRDQVIVSTCLAEFAEQRSWRTNFETQWDETAALIWPAMRNTFTYGSYNHPGEKKTEHQIDSTGMIGLSRFGAISDSMMTPRNMQWHELTADDDYLMRIRRVRLWFQAATKALFKYRYSPIAGFAGQNQGVYKHLGAYGTGCMFVDKPARAPGLRYKNVPLGQIYLDEDHQGVVVGFTRFMRMVARQALTMWKEEQLPQKVREAAARNSPQLFEFIHRVKLRPDHDPERWDSRSMQFASYYISVDCQRLIDESGYVTFPLAGSRYEQSAEEVYGRGPATFVLPALKTLNAEKKVFLKQGHRAADPVLLTADDGIVDMSMRPGSMNKGGWSSQGHPLVGVLPTGEIQITKEMMAEERALINDAFLVTLFQILTESPSMTATEVIERTNEKGILLAPTMGNQSNEYLGPMIGRELDLLSQQGLLPEMPPELIEAQGAYQVRYTSPLAKAARAQEAGGFMRTVEMASGLVNISQDPSLLDPFNFDIAIPQIAEIQSVPESWMASEDQILAKRKNRAQAQAAAAQVQAMPAQAAMAKAETDRAVKLGEGQ